ncbi:protein-disulfide reductase DsbD domain-containing protein [Brevundimonas sp. NIBR11]|uniref:protein-disulfide reductase DsbD family protein n=1 Tax=Brevundimonas sp. NIBR11 TaxID=3015999 RepID=UPI0022F0B031|nr:protein-disulfide reductase DsbD domain-containing protein [Brevundimonas sp. NIBR11]WGM32709.1 Thiol:disulfide interchange protein DsbD [Brevundimonas sp. NIBR11]
MSRLLALLSVLLFATTPVAAQAPGVSLAPTAVAAGPQRTERIEAELVSMSQWAAPGSTAIVAIRQEIQPGWHTYWRNPGDSGGATALEWTLPSEVSAGDIVWPLPERQRLQTLMNYGYQGQVYLPVPIQIPRDARPGTTIPLVVTALFLVCSDEMCVPDELTLRLNLPIRDGAAPLDATHGAAIQSVVETAPRPAGIEARVALEGGVLRLTATGGPLAGLEPGRAWFFPFDSGTVAHAAPQPGERGPEGVTLDLAPGGRITASGLTGPIAGVLATDEGAWEIEATPGPALSGAGGGAALDLSEGEASGEGVSLIGFLQAALFALLGGLILNLMPCVFPILAMKAASLAGSAHDPKEARRDGLAFLGGVLATFFVLAGALLALRAGGQAIGWGFQLQSPGVVAALALLMLAVGLNLSNVFHIGAGLQAAGSSQLSRLPGGVGAFSTGVLAVVVAAPCTAPFMAFALGAALVMPWPMALVVFLMLGLGLALPYVVVSLSPRLLGLLPRPGAWMERLKGVLAFPMYGAGLWLIWVFARQAGEDALGVLFVAALLLTLGLWLVGINQARRAEGGTAVVSAVAAALAIVSAIGVSGAAVSLARSESNAGSAPAGALASQPWSEQAVRAAQAEGRPVLVNFTADWCVTCKINERTSLGSARVAESLAATNAVYLIGDWTRRDDAITGELERRRRSGVPLYLVYAPGSPEPRILPQLLTEGVVIEALEAARP